MFIAQTNADKSWAECSSTAYHDTDCGVCVHVCLDLGSAGAVSLSVLVTVQSDSWYRNIALCMFTWCANCFTCWYLWNKSFDNITRTLFLRCAQCVIVNCLKVAWFEPKHVALAGFSVIKEFCFRAVYLFIFVYETQGDESYEVIKQLFVVNHFWGRNSEMFTRFTNIYVILKSSEYSKFLRRANIRVRTSVSYSG